MALEKLLFNISPDFLLIVQNHNQIKKVNQAFLNITGYASQEIEKSTIWPYIHEDDILPARMFFEVTDTKIHQRQQIIRWKNSDGTYTTFNLIIIKRLKREVLIKLEDISTIQQKESKKYINEQVLHLILDLVPYPVFVKNSQSEYILLNQAQADLFGLEMKEMIGKSDEAFIKKEEELELVRKSDREVISTLQKVILAEQYFTTPNGKNSILQTIKVPFINAITGERNILGVSIDYTDRKIAQDELMKTNFELDNFVYRASHDLKAPLRSVMGLVNLMKTDESKDNIHNCISRIENSIFKLNEFIKDLTDYSRNARLEVQSQSIDLEKVVYHTMENLKYLDPVRKVSVKIQIKSKVPFATDKHRLEVILQNIISNSLKYQNPEELNPRILIEGIVDENEAVLEISDNGIGIKKEYQEGVFKMFYRATELSEGSGLGLYIVKQSIEKLEGHISFNSEENRGTTFKLHIKNLHSSL